MASKREFGNGKRKKNRAYLLELESPQVTLNTDRQQLSQQATLLFRVCNFQNQDMNAYEQILPSCILFSSI